MYVIKSFGKRMKIDLPTRHRGPRRRRSGAARPDLQEDRRAGAHAAAGFARRRDVVPDRHRRAQELRQRTAGQDRRAVEAVVTSSRRFVPPSRAELESGAEPAPDSRSRPASRVVDARLATSTPLCAGPRPARDSDFARDTLPGGDRAGGFERAVLEAARLSFLLPARADRRRRGCSIRCSSSCPEQLDEAGAAAESQSRLSMPPAGVPRNIALARTSSPGTRALTRMLARSVGCGQDRPALLPEGRRMFERPADERFEAVFELHRRRQRQVGASHTVTCARDGAVDVRQRRRARAARAELKATRCSGEYHMPPEREQAGTGTAFIAPSREK